MHEYTLRAKEEKVDKNNAKTYINKDFEKMF